MACPTFLTPPIPSAQRILPGSLLYQPCTPRRLRHAHPALRRVTVRMTDTAKRSEHVLPTNPKTDSATSQHTNTTKENASSTKPFSWIDQWYPVLWVEDFEDDKPYGFTLWDTKLVLFRDKTSGEFSVLLDVCPHRAAPLSQGRMTEFVHEDGRKESVLECPYHGWSFNKCGTCTRIPQLRDSDRIPKAADVKRRFKTAVCEGLVFVWFGKEETADEARLPVPRLLYLPTSDKYTIMRNQTRIVPYDISTLAENLLDPAHFPWAHHRALADKREDVTGDAYIDILQQDSALGYLHAGYQTTKRKPGTDYSFRLTFEAPCFLSYMTFVQGVGEFTICFAGAPAGRGQSRLCSFLTLSNEQKRLPIAKFIPRWYIHMMANTLLDGDAVLLREQERLLQLQRPDGYGGAWKSNYMLSTNTCDAIVLAYRKWLDKTAASMPWLHPPKVPEASETESRFYILDRQWSHTQHCKACKGAQRNMIRARVAAYVIATAAAVATVSALTITAILRQNGSSLRARQLLFQFVALPLLVCLCMLMLASALTTWISYFGYTERAHKLSHGP